MRSPIVMPNLGDSRVVLSVWLAHPGEHVYEGDRLIEVLLDGATFDVAAPCTGRLADKAAWPDDVLTPGQVLGHVEGEGEGLAEPER